MGFFLIFLCALHVSGIVWSSAQYPPLSALTSTAPARAERLHICFQHRLYECILPPTAPLHPSSSAAASAATTTTTITEALCRDPALATTDCYSPLALLEAAALHHAGSSSSSEQETASAFASALPCVLRSVLSGEGTSQPLDARSKLLHRFGAVRSAAGSGGGGRDAALASVVAPVDPECPEVLGRAVQVARGFGRTQRMCDVVWVGCVYAPITY